jgi:hypothetical protein
MVIRLSEPLNRLAHAFTTAITRDDENTSTLAVQLNMDTLYRMIRKELFGRFGLEELGEVGPVFGNWPVPPISMPFNTVFGSFEHGNLRSRYDQLRKFFLQKPSVVVAEQALRIAPRST